MSNPHSRVSAGTPSGGQFATSVHPEPDITLTPETGPAAVGDLRAEWTHDDRDDEHSARIGDLGMRVTSHELGSFDWEVYDTDRFSRVASGKAADPAQARAAAEDAQAEAARWGSAGVREGMRTPWGAAQYAEMVAPGIGVVGTAGHGGTKLSAQRNRAVHPEWRQKGGWYEEDDEWAITAVTFPDAYPEAHVVSAHRLCRDYRPDEYEKVTGATIKPGESYMRDQQNFRAEHREHDVVRGATSSDTYPGMVEVTASRPGSEEQRGYLVPTDEYRTRGRHGFVIDPSRHARTPEE